MLPNNDSNNYQKKRRRKVTEKSGNVVYVTPNSRGLISDCYPITTQTIVKRKDEEKVTDRPKMKVNKEVYVTPNSRGLVSDCYLVTNNTKLKEKQGGTYIFEVIRESDNKIMKNFIGNSTKGTKNVKFIGEKRILVKNFDGTTQEIDLE